MARRAVWERSLAFLQAGVALYGAPLLAAPEPAAAVKNDTMVVEEIVVTATKRAEPLQDVPLSISAITAEDIQARGFSQFADYLNSVPGVYFTDNGPGSSQIRIRGLTAAEGGVASTVATYFGETVTSVLTNHGGKPNLRLVDIERVEVLRGPQGTLFGANALAGVLRIIPASPDPTRFEVNLGTRGYTTAHSKDESYHVEGVVNIPLVQDRLAIRVVGYKDSVAGYIDNEVPAQDAVDYSAALELPDGLLVTPAVAAFTRRDINSEDTWGARAALQWRATDRLRFDLTHLTQEVTLDSEPHITPSVGDFAQSRSLDIYEQGGAGERLDVTTFVVNYNWDALSLTSSSNWADMRRFADQDITFLASLSFGAPIPWALHDRSWGKLFTQEVRLQSLGESPIQWLIGGFYLHQDADLSQFVPDYSCPACLPSLLAGQDFALDYPRSRFSEQEQRAVFGDISHVFASRWTVGAGARYLEEDLRAIDGPVDGILTSPTTQTTQNKGSVYELNPSAYVRFKPREQMTVYVQAGRGFRSGQVNSVLPEQCQPEVAQYGVQSITNPDTLKNYEIGLKSRLADGRLGINAAVFKQKWTGVQVIVGFTCGFAAVINGGDVTGNGVELEMDAQPIDSWHLNAAISYTKNKFDSVTASSGYERNERLPDAPEKNASVGVQYDFSLGGTWSGFARADYLYVGNVRVKFTPDVIVQPSFNTANARLGFHKDALAVELFGRNLTDERAVMTTNNPSFGGNQILLRPRELGVELRYSFH